MKHLFRGQSSKNANTPLKVRYEVVLPLGLLEERTNSSAYLLLGEAGTAASCAMSLHKSCRNHYSRLRSFLQILLTFKSTGKFPLEGRTESVHAPSGLSSMQLRKNKQKTLHWCQDYLEERNLSPDQNHCAAEKYFSLSNASLQHRYTVVTFFKRLKKSVCV